METVEATVATLLGVAGTNKDFSASLPPTPINSRSSHHHKLKSLAAAAQRADLLGADAEEKAAIHQWIELTLRHASSLSSSSSSSSAPHPVDARGLAEELDARLRRRAFVAAARLTLADLVLFAASHAHFAAASFAEKERLLNASRWFAHLQSSFRFDAAKEKEEEEEEEEEDARAKAKNAKNARSCQKRTR